MSEYNLTNTNKLLRFYLQMSLEHNNEYQIFFYYTRKALNIFG